MNHPPNQAQTKQKQNNLEMVEPGLTQPSKTIDKQKWKNRLMKQYSKYQQLTCQDKQNWFGDYRSNEQCFQILLKFIKTHPKTIDQMNENNFSVLRQIGIIYELIDKHLQNNKKYKLQNRESGLYSLCSNSLRTKFIKMTKFKIRFKTQQQQTYETNSIIEHQMYSGLFQVYGIIFCKSPKKIIEKEE